ncbi:MAG TPA: serine hydrolase, partial [Negativicutes bacterium]|nr:serine hydrolase [Negativicutes bacterium]
SLETMNGKFSIVLKDLNNDSVLYEKDPARQVASASTIKILIMIEAYNQLLKGELDLNEKLTVKNDEKVAFSLVTVMNTDYYTLRDYIVLMMTVSDNTATNVVMDRLGIDRINETGKLLGLCETRLQRKMMDFKAIEEGRQNYTSAKEMAGMVERLYRHEILTPEACEEMLAIMSINTRKEEIARYLPPEIRVAHKGGSLDNLNHDIGIVFHPQGDYLLGIFGTELPNNIEGEEYIAQLSRKIFEHMYTI